MRTAMLIYFDLLPSLETLSNAEAGKLFKAILRYNVQGVLPEKLGKCEALLFQQLKAQHDRDAAHMNKPVRSGARRPGSGSAPWMQGKAIECI